LNRCGTDAVRWYLLRDIQFGDDGDFQQQRFVDLVNNDLANTIGNLLNRTSSMSRKWFNESTPIVESEHSDHHALRQAAETTIATVRESMPSMAFQKASEAILQLAIQANGYLNDQAPWSKMKKGGLDAEVALDLYGVLESARLVGWLLQPIVPDLSERILAQLNQSSDVANWSGQLVWGGLELGHPLPQPQPVMQRLELEEAL
jgi:methionyl-tRNA synthetase